LYVRHMRVSYSDAWGWQVVTLALTVAACGNKLGYSPAVVTSEMLRTHRKVGPDYVRDSMKRFRKYGDPNHRGDRRRRSNKVPSRAQRLWLKALFRQDPDLYFDEAELMFRRAFRRTISDRQISKALKHQGGRGTADAALSLKVLQMLARQRDEARRTECRLGLQGLDPDCIIIIDESHIDDSSSRRRRGWAPINEPAKVYEMFSGDGTLRSVLATVNKDALLSNITVVISPSATMSGPRRDVFTTYTIGISSAWEAAPRDERGRCERDGDPAAGSLLRLRRAFRFCCVLFSGVNCSAKNKPFWSLREGFRGALPVFRTRPLAFMASNRCLRLCNGKRSPSAAFIFPWVVRPHHINSAPFVSHPGIRSSASLHKPAYKS